MTWKIGYLKNQEELNQVQPTITRFTSISVRWHPISKYQEIKNFGGCWRISLGKENLSSDFEGPYLEKSWRYSHMWWMVYLIRFPSFIWHMISKKRKISKFLGILFWDSERKGNSSKERIGRKKFSRAKGDLIICNSSPL